MAYATVEQVEAGFRPLTTDEKAVCNQLLDEAAIQLDAIAPRATAEAKESYPVGWCVVPLRHPVQETSRSERHRERCLPADIPSPGR